MKWLALVLLCANLALWLVVAEPEPVSDGKDPAGRLPRVAPLKSQLSPTAGVGAHAEQYCVRLGWFDGASPASVAAATLNLDAAKDVAIRELERSRSPLYWVLVPPEKTDAGALARFRDIQRQGIDAYLVTEGPQKNAISLGLFESESAAERVLMQQNKKNFHATLVLFPRNQLSYALVFEAIYVPDSEELKRVAADLSSRFEWVEIKRCEGIATAENNP